MSQHASAAPQKASPKKSGRATSPPAPPAPEAVDAVALAQSWESIRGALRPGTSAAPGDPPAARAPASVQRSCACGGTCKDCSEDKIGIRTKLKVGPPGDAFEREADSVAARVLGLSRAPVLPSFPAPVVPEAVHSVQPVASDRVGRALRPGRTMPADAPSPPDSAALTRGGSPLSASLRAFFEPRFGRDLSEVRVHTGPAADAWSSGLDAHAFTYANHVWLGRGHAPTAGFLLAHELAHVVQQRQPRALAQASGGAGEGAALSTGGAAVQRRRLSEPFWVPLSATGMMGGSTIHQQLLGRAKTNNAQLDIEAPAPNSNAKDFGLALEGSIDLFLGEHMPGINFDGRPRGEQHPDPAKTTPKKHGRAGMKTPRAGRFKPYFKDGNIEDIDQGPREPKLGELKPAALTLLNEGATQLGNYDQGLKMASELTNKWADRMKVGKHWNVGTPGRLGDADVSFKDGSDDMKYDPANPKADTPLVLASIEENFARGAKYDHKVLFNPRNFGLSDIMGGLYAQKFNGASGLWMYFARPRNLDEARNRARSALIRAQMTLANQVQDQVINVLLEPPQKEPKTLSKSPAKVAKLAKGAGRPPPPRLAPAALGIRRAPATPKLKDDFDLKKWKQDQVGLRGQISGPGAKEETKKQVEAMEFLHEAYKAEATLNEVPGIKKSKLPGKGSDMAEIAPGKGKTGTPKKKDLSDLGGWIRGWTSKPAEILGLFRDKFGGSFTTVANKLIDLRDKVRKKFQEHFDKKAGVKSKSGKAKYILLALGKALGQVAKILLPRTLHLVMDAVEAGIRKKLEKVFNLDPAAMVEEKFGDEFRTWNDLLDGYKKQADNIVKDTVGEYTKNLGWIQEFIDLGKKVGPIIEAAVAGVQCVSPPVWGCLKLLAKKLNDCALAKVLNICTVQQEIAGLTMEIKPLKDLPVDLGKQAMVFLKKAAPAGLEDIFDEPLATPPEFDPTEIECEFTPLPSGCPNWGLIELEGGKGAPPKEGGEGEGGGKDTGQPDAGEGKGGSKPDAGQPESGAGQPEPDAGQPEPDAGQPQPRPDAGQPQPQPDAGQPQPAPDAGSPEPGPEGGTPPQAEDPNKQMEEFLDKLTKEELDELWRELERRGMLDKPFDPSQTQELLDTARKNLQERKRQEAKRKAAERARKEQERLEKEKSERESKGEGGKGAEGPGGTAGGSGGGTTCVWDSSQLSVGGFVLRGTKSTASDILDEGHTHTQPFKQDSIFGCGGVTLTIKTDYYFGSMVCPREGAFAKPTVSLEIRFKSVSADRELFNQSDANPWTNEIFAEPSWGSRVELEHINSNGTLEIKMRMHDPDTGVTKSISAKIPIDVNCT